MSKEIIELLEKLNIRERADDIWAFQKESNLSYDQQEAIRKYSCLLHDAAKILDQVLAKIRFIKTEETKWIPLTQGKFAIVDEKNYEMLSKHKWYANYNQGKWYAQREIINEEGKRITVRMHRAIMNCPDEKQIDHRNHNGLDNRESNLRICTNTENQHNQQLRKGGSSKYKGVSWKKDIKKWTAHIKKDGVLINLGKFDDEIKAAEIYDIKAKELYGEFACFNFPEGSEFTKECRRILRRCDMPRRQMADAQGSSIWSNVIWKKLDKACDIIDIAEAISKIKDKRILAFEAMVKAGGECCDILQERIDVLSEGIAKAKKEG